MKSLHQIIFEVLISEIHDARPIKIKATYDFKSWLVAHDKTCFIKDDSKRGFYVALNFIPIVVDDTIDNEYYELVY